MICLMARKTHSQEFHRQAVELCEYTPGTTFKGIPSDLTSIFRASGVDHDPAVGGWSQD